MAKFFGAAVLVHADDTHGFIAATREPLSTADKPTVTVAVRSRASGHHKFSSANSA